MPRFTTKIPTQGPSGNVFAILANATRLMRQLNLPKEEIEAFCRRVNASRNYDAACAVVEEYFPLDKDD